MAEKENPAGAGASAGLSRARRIPRQRVFAARDKSTQRQVNEVDLARAFKGPCQIDLLPSLLLYRPREGRLRQMICDRTFSTSGLSASQQYSTPLIMPVLL